MSYLIFWINAIAFRRGPIVYDDAIKQGWKHETIVNRLRDNISDVYGKEFSDAVLERIELYAQTLNK